jgi:hypothetical protein
MFKDNSGVRHLTNVPTSPKYRLYLKSMPSKYFKNAEPDLATTKKHVLLSHKYDITVLDFNSDPVKGATIEYSIKGKDNIQITGTSISKEDGKFVEKMAFKTAGPSSFDFEITAEGYYSYRDTFSISNSKKINIIEKIILIKPIDYFHKDFTSDLNSQFKNNIKLFIDLILLKGSVADCLLEKRSINLIKFKDNDYIQFKFTTKTVYNSLKLNKYDIGKEIFDNIVRKILDPLNDTNITGDKYVYGYDIIVIGNTKSFLDKYGSPQKIEYRYLLPANTAKKYKDKDISGQKLLDGSIFLIDDERNELKLQ